MTSVSWIRRLATLVLAASVLTAVGCGGEEGSEGAELGGAFAAAADRAYEAAGKDRAEDFALQVTIDDCFILPAGADAALADAVGLKQLELATVLIGGPPENEMIQCYFGSDGRETQAIGGVFAGATTLTPEQFRDQIIRNRKGGDDIEGNAPGLDPDRVVAIRDEETGVYAWVDDGFFVSVTSPDPDPDIGYAALGVAVEQAQGALAG